MKLSSLVFLLLLFQLPRASWALTLVELQRAALENRPMIKGYETEVEKSGEAVRIAGSSFYPSVDVRYNAYTLDEQTETAARNNSLFSGSVTWNLFNGFKDRRLLDSAHVRRQVETLQLKAVVQDIQLAVALKYLAVYNQRARLKVAEDNLKTLERLYRDSEHRFNVGLLDKNEVLKFKIDYSNATLTVRREEAGLRKTLNDLEREVALNITGDELTFSEFSRIPILKDQHYYEQQMPAARSELKMLQGRADAAELDADARYGNFYPHLDVIGRYSAYDDNLLNGQGEGADEEVRTELTLSLNLFDGFLDKAEIAAARATARSLTYDRAELLTELHTELRNLFVDYQVNLADVEVAREDITYAEENVRITELKYKEGLQRQLDLLNAVAARTRAQSNYVSVLRDVFDNYFRIVRMIEGFPGKT